MTIQEAFTKCVRGLRDQGWKKAVMGGDWIHGQAKLRTNSGLKCAIGQLIPDAAYKAKLEAFMDNNLRCALDEAGVQIESGKGHILDKMVQAHDYAVNRLDMHRRFRDVAHTWGLDFPADCVAPDMREAVEGEIV